MMVLQNIALTAPTTSYANSGGTGNRTASITVTRTAAALDVGNDPARLVDGSFVTGAGGSCNASGTVGASEYVRFDFGAATKKYIDELKIYYDRVPANGSWKIQASNDASSWTDLVTFTWNQQTQTLTLTGVDVEGYRYYQMIFPAGGGITGAWFEELEFKIAAGAV